MLWLNHPNIYIFPRITVKQEGVKCIKCHCSKNVMTHPSCPSVCSTNNIRTYNIVVQNICTWNILVNICSYDICTDIVVWNNCQWQNWSLNTISGTDNTAVWNICTDNIVAWELGNLSRHHLSLSQSTSVTLLQNWATFDSIKWNIRRWTQVKEAIWVESCHIFLFCLYGLRPLLARQQIFPSQLMISKLLRWI